MLDRSGSPAFRYLSPAARRALALIEDEAARSSNGVCAISIREFRRRIGMPAATTGYSLRQLTLLGLIKITPGQNRRNNLFQISSGWTHIDAVAAKRLRRMAGASKQQATPPAAPSVMAAADG